jgi:antitoxin component of MazEF toxin-antitoxin module
VTIPQVVVERLGIEPGAELKVETENGRIVLEPSPTLGERRREAIRKYSGAFTGVYPPGYLEDLRDEWER